MKALGRLKRMRELNEIAVKSMFTGVDLEKHSDYSFWAHKITKITSQLVNEECLRSTEFVHAESIKNIEDELRFCKKNGQWTKTTHSKPIK